MIEEIAKQWFDTETTTNSPRWENQPERIKEHYRALARQFWDNPGKLTRELQSIEIRTRQMTSDIERATKAWL